MFTVGPVEAGSRTSPRADERPLVVELEHRRRRAAALVLGYGPRTVQDPDVIVPVDGNPRNLAEHPVVRELRPRGVHLEPRHGARTLSAHTTLARDHEARGQCRGQSDPRTRV